MKNCEEEEYIGISLAICRFIYFLNSPRGYTAKLSIVNDFQAENYWRKDEVHRILFVIPVLTIFYASNLKILHLLSYLGRSKVTSLYFSLPLTVPFYQIIQIAPSTINQGGQSASKVCLCSGESINCFENDPNEISHSHFITHSDQLCVFT